ncbi:MAG: MFS transporter [Thermodesulfobacteriota bacterium]
MGREGRIFYGWYILAAAFLALAVGFGVRPSFGLFFKAIADDFGLSRASLGLVVSINMLTYGLVQPFMGQILDRYGPKLVIGVSAIALAGGFMLIGIARAAWQLYLVYGILLGAAFGGLGFTTIPAMVSRWFVKKRGLALGIAISGASVGQFALVPVAAFFFLKYGWRSTNLLLGFLVLVTSFPLALWVMKKDPSEVGCGPDGDPLREGKASKEGMAQERLITSTSPGQAFQTRPFWHLAGAFFVCGFSSFLIVTHLAAHITDVGHSDVVAATVLAVTGGVNFFGILLMGAASDRMGRRFPLAATYFIRGLSFLLLLTSDSVSAFYIFAVVFGFSNLATVPVTSALVGDTFGPAHLGTILGVVSLSHQLGAALGAFLGGMVFDYTGSYSYAFIMAFLLLMVASLLSITMEERSRAELLLPAQPAAVPASNPEVR